MPSEHRLHPVSILFAFGRSLKIFALPGLLFLVVGRSGPSGPPIPMGRWPGSDFAPDGSWQLWLMILLIPSALAAVARYLSFRVRYEGTELVIRSGIFFRNERHVPYHRIQNLDAVQNLFHRAFGVVEVRVETGAGKEPEATISVLPAAAFVEMRRHVFEGRARPDDRTAPDDAAVDAAAPAADASTLLRLPVRELVLLGLLENRGIVVVGAIYGLLWELGLLNVVWSRVLGEGVFARGIVRDTFRAVFSGGAFPLGRIAILGAGIAGFLIVVRLFSIAWATTRLYGFHLSRVGEDLRTEFGLFTRVATTIPLRRVQTVIIREGLLQRLVMRMSIRVETAGGGKAEPGEKSREREWLAPIIRRGDVAALVTQVVPELDLTSIVWQPVHPRAFRRVARKSALVVLAIAVLWAAPLELWTLGEVWITLAFVPFVLGWAVFSARQYVRHLHWAVTDDVVMLRSGWLWRNVTVARVAKIQAVTQIESPFDRRAAMARVRVDTAGAGDLSHRVDIPYLGRDVAAVLYQRLAIQAAGTEFRW